MKIQQAIDSGELFLVGVYMFPGKADRRAGVSKTTGNAYDMVQISHTLVCGSGDSRHTEDLQEVYDVAAGTPKDAPQTSRHQKVKEGQHVIAFVSPRGDKRTGEVTLRLLGMHALEA